MRHKNLLFNGEIVIQLKTPPRPGPCLEFFKVRHSIWIDNIRTVTLRTQEPTAVDGFDPRLKPVHQGFSFRWRNCRRQQQRMVASGANS